MREDTRQVLDDRRLGRWVGRGSDECDKAAKSVDDTGGREISWPFFHSEIS